MLQGPEDCCVSHGRQKPKGWRFLLTPGPTMSEFTVMLPDGAVQFSLSAMFSLRLLTYQQRRRGLIVNE